MRKASWDRGGQFFPPHSASASSCISATLHFQFRGTSHMIKRNHCSKTQSTQRQQSRETNEQFLKGGEETKDAKP